MAIISVNPLFMKESVFSVGADDFAIAINSVTFTPTTSVSTFKGLKPSAVFTQVSSPEWTCEVVFAQDYSTNTSLSVYLFNNVGQKKAVTFTPVAGGRSITATVLIVPGAIGGALDAFATATVSLGVDGQPVLGAIA